jgi:hypothetical protein
MLTITDMIHALVFRVLSLHGMKTQKIATWFVIAAKSSGTATTNMATVRNIQNLYSLKLCTERDHLFLLASVCRPKSESFEVGPRN